MGSEHSLPSYHHGDLRRALMEAGRELVAAQGIDGFTMRQVARRVGVSHTAPYHHFRDKDALVEALAADGYRALARALTLADTPGDGTPLERLEALGVAYVRFAVDRPAEFRLMTRTALGKGESTSVANDREAASQAAFDVLVGAVRDGQAAGAIADAPAEGLAFACWAAVHGLAVLLLDGLGHPKADPDELARLVTGTLVSGLRSHR